MRGAIAEIRGSKAIMLTEGGEFITLRNKNYSVGQKVIVSKKAYRKFSALAACFILFVMIGGGVWGYYTPVSYLDIDINPSFRLELNIFDRVIDVEPLNEDARNFLKIMGFLPQNMGECMDEITVKAKKYGYINKGNSNIYIHSVSSKKNFLPQLNKYAKNISEKENVHIYANSEKRETLGIAREHKVSVGRIKLIEEYTKTQGGTIDENIAILTGKTNKEIRTAIAEQSKQETPANVKSDKTKENSRSNMPENIPEKSNPSNDNVVTNKGKSQKKPEIKNENVKGKNNKEKRNNGNSKNQGNKK